MAISGNFPASRPSLLLDFANVGRLDPRVTFARASTATYYDGVTTAKAEQNLLLQSQTLDVSPWIAVTSGVTANATTAPDGTSTADKVTPDNTSAAHYIRQVITGTAQTYAFSVFAKADGYSWLQLWDAFNIDFANFDVTNGVTGQVSAGVTATITSIGSGWYRCTIVKALSAASAQMRIGVYDSDANRSATFTGDGTSGIFLWGAQLEQRSAVTAYTATTTQAITNYIPVLQTAASGVARFDHTPTTGAALGLEIEEQRTNLVTYSEDFANAAWTKSNSSITSNTIVAPDGTLTGDKLIENTATSTHGVAQNATVVDATTYTYSFFAKAAERTRVRIRFGTSLGSGTFLGSADFDLSSGVVVADSSITSSSITPVGNGWYRCTATDVSSGTTLGVAAFLIESGATTSYTGDGYSGVYIWGAQLEEGEFPTSYIATTTTALTRSADVGDITGSNFTDFYNNSEGTFYVEGSVNNEAGQLFSVEQGNGSVSNSIIIGFFSGTPQFRVRGPSSATQAVFSLTASLSTNSKYAGAYATNSFNASANGSIAADDTSGLPPSPQDNLKIGRNGSSGSQINGTIKKIAYYPVRLSNAQLQALTG